MEITLQPLSYSLKQLYPLFFVINQLKGKPCSTCLVLIYSMYVIPILALRDNTLSLDF